MTFRMHWRDTSDFSRDALSGAAPGRPSRPGAGNRGPRPGRSPSTRADPGDGSPRPRPSGGRAVDPVTPAPGAGPRKVPQGGRSAAIDGIRGLAALALLTVHVGMFSGL